MHLRSIQDLDHDKSQIVLHINYLKQTRENPSIESWLKTVEGLGYSKVIVTQDKNIRNAKIETLKATVSNNCDYYFTTDALIENRNLISLLIAEDRPIVSPMITAHESIYSNFWAHFVFDTGYYQRHATYQATASYKNRGIFGVPLIWGSYLIKAEYCEEFSKYYLSDFKFNSKPLSKMDERANLNPWWLDLYFSAKLSVDRPLYMVNREHYGYLIERDLNEKDRLHQELYTYQNHKYLWKKFYYSDEFFNRIYKGGRLHQTEPCRDVFVWDFFKPIFGKHLIEEAEHFGEWSDGGHNQKHDPRLGGTESYPTQDIHLNQFGLHETWEDIVKNDIAQLAAQFYSGTGTKGINIAFIVRYKPGAQSFLRPHHDSSLYTVAVALNKQGVEFEGGGVRFLRYNCSYIPPEPGHALMHPGRVTHRHEGLVTTAGTRYIFVTFIN